MQKIFATLMLGLFAATALPVAAENSTSTKPLEHKKTVDITCVQAAVEKRDSAIITAYSAYSTAVIAAMTARKDALKAAWAITVRKDRIAALRSAWTTYTKATREAKREWNKKRLASWNQWFKDRKVCRATDDITSSGSDASI